MKAPAFQFYPRDWDTDENVIPMSYEEEGVYFALCRRYWLAGNTLPSDLERLRRLLKGRPSLAKMRRWWEVIGPCFQIEGDVLTHKRLDRERDAQAHNRAQRKAAAEKRWKERAERDANASASHPSRTTEEIRGQSTATASSTATAPATAVRRESAPSAPAGRASYLSESRTVWSHPKGYSLYRGKHYDDLVARFDGSPEKLHAWLEAQVDQEPERIGNFLRFIDERLDAEKRPRQDRPFTAAERQNAERARKSVGRCFHDPACSSFAGCIERIMRDSREKAKVPA